MVNQFVRSTALRTTLSVFVGTLYLAFLLSLSQHGSWLGYGAGFGDHDVLMPQGIQWAIPDAFRNDWFLQAAPQPHWFFDIIISIGISTGTTDYILLAYWLLGLAAFVLATVLLAQMIVARYPFLASLLMLTVAGVAPWGLFGSGTGTIAMALPTVLAGNLIYLVIVLLLRKNMKTAAAIGAVVAIVHVQQGSIIAIIFAVTLASVWISQKKVPWALVIGFAINVAFVIFGLKLRPVASNPADFVEVCNTIIPYHCAVWKWRLPIQLSAVGGFLAAMLTLLAVKRSQRLIWTTTIGLVILGYAGGFLSDAFRVPFLGELAQSVNANRLGSIIAPFMFWGMLFPLLKLRSFARFRRLPGATWIFLLVWLVLTGLVFLDPAWHVSSLIEGLPRTLLLIGAVIALLLLASRQLWPEIGRWLSVIPLIALCVLSAIFGGTLQPHPTINWYARGEPNDVQRWYIEVGQQVPAGEIVTAPGLSNDLRLYSQRATIVDCKNVPYGGKAWKEWKQRTRDLGIDCNKQTTYGSDMTPVRLEQLARKYDSRFVVVENDFHIRYGAELLDRNWKLRLDAGPVGWWLYELPDDD